MADLATEMHHLAEADVRVELIRRQIAQQERCIHEARRDGRDVSVIERTLMVLHKTEHAFIDHRSILRETIERLQR